MTTIPIELKELMQQRKSITERISSDKSELQKINEEIERISLEQEPRADFIFGNIGIFGCYGFTNLAFGNPFRKELLFFSDSSLFKELITEFKRGDVCDFKIIFDDVKVIYGVCAIKSLKQENNKLEIIINRIDKVKYSSF